MKHLRLITFILFLIKVQAQEASSERSIWGIQLGIYPLSIYNEAKITNNIALRSELWMGYASSSSIYSSHWEILPYIQVEPRWYYNLQRRADKAKQTTINSGYYLSLQLGANLALE